MPNLKYLNINGVNYSLGRDTRIHYGSTSETITDLQEGDLLIDLVEIPPAGKNLLGLQMESATIYYNGTTASGDNNRLSLTTTSTSTWRNMSLRTWLKAGTYTLSLKAISTDDYVPVVTVYNDSGSAIMQNIKEGTPKSFTLNEHQRVEFRFFVSGSPGAIRTVTYYDVQLELGSTATAYEKYNGNTYSVSFGNAGTVYGGTLDVVSGQLTVDRKYFTADEKTWSWGGGTYVYTNIADTDKTQRTVVVSSHFQSRTASGTADGYISWGGSPNNGNMIVRSSAVAPDLASWNTYISNNTVQFVYYLATPLTYQLTATQVALLRGDSKIWSDSGDTSVIYTNIDDITSTASGSIANITSAKKALAQSVVTEINCKQDLNGYDHPWAGGAGKNKLKNTATSTTINNVVFTVNADGSVTANGLASANAQLNLTIDTSNVYGDLYFNCAYNGSGTTYDSYMWDNTASARCKKWNGTTNSSNGYKNLEEIKIVQGHTTTLVIRVYSGYNANNVKFYPMICSSTETETTFAPYENICPITGYNNINITKINPLYDTSETGTRMYKYNEDATWTEISVSGNGGLLNLENGSATGSVRGINTFSEDGPYVMGQNAVAVGGSTQAAGANSFTSGLGTVAQRGSQAVFGEYNTLDITGSTSTRGDYAFIIGNGTANTRSNATTIDWEGSMDTHGAITAGSIDNGYGLNDQALLASDTIALWEDIING